jgi:hypothetical protein
MLVLIIAVMRLTQRLSLSLIRLGIISPDILGVQAQAADAQTE